MKNAEKHQLLQAAMANGRLILESDLPQGSPEWLEWRGQGVGASEAWNLVFAYEDLTGNPLPPSIANYLGKKPPFAKSPATLAAEKRGEIQPEDLSGNPNVMRGNRLEPEIRAYAEKRLNVDLDPVCIIGDKPHRRVSLDGLGLFDNPATAVITEIKAPQEKSVDKWMQKGPPVYYEIQLAYQRHTVRSILPDYQFRAGFAIGTEGPHGLEGALFASECPEPDLLEKVTIEAIDAFWEMLTNGEVLPADIADMRSDEAYVEMEAEYVALLDEQDRLKTQVNALKSELETRAEQTGKDRAEGKLTRYLAYERVGNVQWKRLCADLGISEETIEQYRGKSARITRLERIPQDKKGSS